MKHIGFYTTRNIACFLSIGYVNEVINFNFFFKYTLYVRKLNIVLYCILYEGAI